jgi:ribonuclease D
MTIPPKFPVEIISQSTQLATAIQDISNSPIIALDTELNSLHHYPEQLCLIQIANCHKNYIMDTILLKDIGSLTQVLENKSIIKVLHTADSDIRSLDRHHGIHMQSVHDVKIAAIFAGIYPFSLVSLVKDLLGITLRKSKRLQKADWAQRPLSAEAIEYAANDVHHLVALKQILDDRLQVLKRAAWVAEEYTRLEDIRYIAPDVSTRYLSIKGTQKLDGQNLAVLKSLYLFRESEARRRHRPPSLLIPDIVLSCLANNPSMPLSEVPSLGQIGLRRFGKGLQQALRKGLAAIPIQRVSSVPRISMISKELRRLTLLKTWRASLGETLSLEPSLLWPKASLERLAKAPNTLEIELKTKDIRRWQHEQFVSSLKGVLKLLP